MSECRDPGDGEFNLGQHKSLLASDPQRYAEVVRDVAAYGIYLLDRDGLILSWNLGATNITGYLEQDVLGKPFGSLFADEAQREGLPQKSLQFARAHRHHKDEQPRRQKNGGELIALCTLDAVRQDNGEIGGFVEVFADISEQKHREASLYQRATRDALTGLFNRGHFTEMATLEIERARRFSEPLSLVLMNLDHFKLINDSYGHEAGERTIVEFSKICLEFARKIDIVGHLGGKEFAMMLPRSNKEPAFEVLQRLRVRVLASRIKAADGTEFGITISAGIAALRPHTHDLRELMRNADAALYKAKREGRNRVETWFE